MPRELYGLSRDDIRALTRPSNLAGAYAVASIWLVIAATLVALARWPHPLTFALAVVVLGGRQLALAVAMHDAAHGTLFRTRWLNDHVADLVCAAPVWSDTARYRRHHLAHHAHTGTERDPDLSLALDKPMSRGSLARKVARDLLGSTGLKRVVGLLLIDLELLAFDVSGRARRLPYRGFAVHARAGLRHLWKPALANIVLAALAGWTYAAWAVAYLTTFSLVVRVRSLAEHAGMARGEDPLRNTRSTRAGVLARTIFAPLHVNYHLEHHLLPTVPWFRLPALHRRLAAQIPASSSARGYVDVLRAVTHQ
jgi:fatty acid desaturase